MSILFVTDGLSAEFVVECLLWYETDLDEAVRGINLLGWIDLLAEKEIELFGAGVDELSAN